MVLAGTGVTLSSLAVSLLVQPMLGKSLLHFSAAVKCVPLLPMKLLCSSSHSACAVTMLGVCFLSVLHTYGLFVFD